ncbi:Ribosomal large subunit pseudouridine synthase B [bioreactor metagenome]|uniref:Ribosomal large subunit pseudouridine synthase B n=1 Tax=bioreactor metagenome TaxID=1076179 RepID=A0A644XE16_9ZZZZ
MEERLQKILSSAGVCSRRSAEEYILQGRVKVNGLVASLGDKADPSRDRVEVDEEPLAGTEKKIYLMLNKPRGYVTTLSDEKGRKAVTELITGCGARVWPVGRLDLNSEGLLFLTNDGEFTYHLTHPKCQVEKEYLAWVAGDAEAALPILSEPMTVDGERFHPAVIRILKREKDTALLSVIIREGKNRQVRRMCAAAGVIVTRLKRVREGKIILDSAVKSGQWRYLTPDEIRLLSEN